KSAKASDPRGTPSDPEIAVRWQQVCQSVATNLNNPNPFERMWARSTSVDLMLVAQAEHWKLHYEVGSIENELARMLEDGGGNNWQAIWPTFRQFGRVNFWWRTRKGWAEDAKRGYEFLWERIEPTLEISELLGEVESPPAPEQKN